MLTNLKPPGPTGVSGVNGLTFAFLGCYAQGCTPSGCPGLSSYAFDSAASSGGFNSTVSALSSNANVNSACAALCLTKSKANFFGTVNNSTAPSTADCYCGVAITGLVSALANCVVCQGGNGVGECGQTGSTIAVYARAF